MNSTKLWLLIAVGLIVIGILGAGLALGSSRGNTAGLFSPLAAAMETTSFDIDEDFLDITLRGETEDITFLPAEDGRCRVVFREPDGSTVSAGVKNGTLEISSRDTRPWFRRISLFSPNQSSVTIWLPPAAYGALAIEESTGDIDLPADFTFDSVDIRLSTGDAALYSSVKGKCAVQSSTGGIHLAGLNAGELNLTASTGRIELADVDCGGAVSVTVSTGDTVLQNLTCRSLHTVGSTGDLEMTDVIVPELLSVERSTGDVRFTRCDAGEITIRTSTGDVSGTLLTGKAFLARTDTGRVRVPESTAGGKCEITTDTGSITVSIA